MTDALTFARYAVFGLFVAAALLALGSWLVRTRRVSPFSAAGRWLRAATDPILRPIESRVVRLGGNPVNAGWWLVIGAAIAGVLALSLLGWLVASAQRTWWAVEGGPRAILLLVADAAFGILYLAIFVRVIASWFGIFAYSRWIRPAYVLTDWLVKPIRRLLPPVAMIDFSPLVALVVLWLLKRLVLAVLL